MLIHAIAGGPLKQLLGCMFEAEHVATLRASKAPIDQTIASITKRAARRRISEKAKDPCWNHVRWDMGAETLMHVFLRPGGLIDSALQDLARLLRQRNSPFQPAHVLALDPKTSRARVLRNAAGIQARIRVHTSDPASVFAWVRLADARSQEARRAVAEGIADAALCCADRWGTRRAKEKLPADRDAAVATLCTAKYINVGKFIGNTGPIMACTGCENLAAAASNDLRRSDWWKRGPGYIAKKSYLRQLLAAMPLRALTRLRQSTKAMDACRKRNQYSTRTSGMAGRMVRFTKGLLVEAKRRRAERGRKGEADVRWNLFVQKQVDAAKDVKRAAGNVPHHEDVLLSRAEYAAVVEDASTTWTNSTNEQKEERSLWVRNGISQLKCDGVREK